MAKYTREFRVRNYEVDSRGMLKETNLLNYLEEVAISHSEDVSLSMESFLKNQKAWMVYKWKINIDTYPKVNSLIKIESWISRLYKFYANREYRIYDENKNLIGRVSSLWLYVNLDRRLPTRIPKDFIEIYGVREDKNFEDFISKKAINKDLFSGGQKYSIRKSDIDYNNHVNNVSYLNWIIEALPLEFINYKIEELDLIYVKETNYKEKVKVSFIVEEIRDSKIKVKHLITGDSGEVKFYGETKWMS